MYSRRPLHMDEQRQDNQLEPTYSNSVSIRDVALKTCRKQWMVEKGGERWSGISVLVAWHDDNDNDYSSGKFEVPNNKRPSKNETSTICCKICLLTVRTQKILIRNKSRFVYKSNVVEIKYGSTTKMKMSLNLKKIP